jgi:predicted PurR-regulated permease PerM
VDIRSVSSGTVLRVVAIVFGVLIALRFLWIAYAIFIVAFLGILLGLAVARAADFLERIHIRRAFGAPLVIFAGLALLAGLGVLMAPALKEQTRQLSDDLPRFIEAARKRLERSPAKALAQPSQPETEQKEPAQKAPQKEPGQKEPSQNSSGQLSKQFEGFGSFLFPIASSALGAIGGFILVIFIAMYIGAEPGLYHEGILHLVPHRHRKRAEEVLRTLTLTLRQWLVARLMAMVAIGTITGVALALLDVKGAIALGVLAGLLEFIPFFGPVMSAIPALGVALLDSPQKALSVLILYVVLQQLEGNVITPLLLEKRLDIPPVLTVVTVAALGVVFGVVGMLIAEPLLAVVLVTTKMLYVNDVVGDEVKVGGGG